MAEKNVKPAKKAASKKSGTGIVDSIPKMNPTSMPETLMDKIEPTEPISGEELRKLPETYKNRGITFTQVDRNDNAAMYKSDTGSFEVFKITIDEAGLVKFPGQPEKMLPRREHMPTDGEFGKLMFAYQSEEAAKRKYTELSE